MALVFVATYKFVHIEDPHTFADQLREKCESLDIRGTILIAFEGINIQAAGEPENIAQFEQHMHADARFADMEFKRSNAEHQAFWKLKVKVKNEIIRMNTPEIMPSEHTAPHVDSKVLQQWLDEGREVVMMDTRNDYEIEFGTFENAVHFNIDEFGKFPEAVREHGEAYKDKTVVTFCTGGIRCEKAAALMQNEGFTDVYQLDGGILKYFEETGGAHWDGTCYVFDGRVAVDKNLNETGYMQCADCNKPIYNMEREGNRAFIRCPGGVPGCPLGNDTVADDNTPSANAEGV